MHFSYSTAILLVFLMRVYHITSLTTSTDHDFLKYDKQKNALTCGSLDRNRDVTQLGNRIGLGL